MPIEMEPTVPATVDLNDAVAKFMSAFEAFKTSNDQRLAEIETRMGADLVTTDKVDRINAELDEQKRRMDGLLKKSIRPVLGETKSYGDDTHRSAFHSYMRRGETSALASLEAKSLSGATGADGGFLIPKITEDTILTRMAALSPIRSIATVLPMAGASFKKPVTKSAPTTGWVGETDARPETTNQQIDELEIPAMELYAMPAATQSLLDDAAIDVDAWIAEEVRIAFAEQESAAFVAGDGNKKPKGFTTYPTVANTSWTWGNIGTVGTGVSGDFAASDPGDAILDLVYAVKAGYRQNGKFVMNRKTQAEIRKMKDADGNYLWQPSAQPGGSASLFNFQIVESEDMPDIAADSLSVAFGDFHRGYVIVDRLGVRVLRDPFSAKPYVLFYTTKRVGGAVQDFDAIKFLQFT